MDELLLPEVINSLADEERGLILVTGTTGSGKSTTLAAMIDHINSNYAKHIVTIEDPAEFLHRDKMAIINQREVGEDTVSFARALRRVLRQDPDVILIGEMRDEETVRTALSAAETGHLVLSTIHTVDASESVNRIIDFFDQAEQRQARAMLAGTLKGVVSQRLVPTPDGLGRVPTCEILRMTGRVRDMILNPDDTGRLPEVIAEGGYYGMQTFDQALLQHFQAGRVSMEDALKAATHPHDFRLLVASEGKRHTSVETVDRGRAERRRPRPSAACPAQPSALTRTRPSKLTSSERWTSRWRPRRMRAVIPMSRCRPATRRDSSRSVRGSVGPPNTSENTSANSIRKLSSAEAEPPRPGEHERVRAGSEAARDPQRHAQGAAPAAPALNGHPQLGPLPGHHAPRGPRRDQHVRGDAPPGADAHDRVLDPREPAGRRRRRARRPGGCRRAA